MRLFYHGESDSMFLAEPGEWQQTGDGALSDDVSDIPEYRNLAVLDGIDLDEIKPLDYYDKLDDDFMACDIEEPVKTVKSSGGLSGAIIASMDKWARKPADLYPTPPDCTYSLIPHIEHLLPAGSRVLEPACADGQMSRALEQFGYAVESFDLRPDVKYGEGGHDFLDPKHHYPSAGYYDAVITNPPFKAADLFIRRALEEAPVVAMLLKAQYWNTDNRKKLFRETKPYMELNLTWRPAFLEAERGKSPLMDCMWMVWKRGHNDLPKVNILDRLMSCPMSEASFGGL